MVLNWKTTRADGAMLREVWSRAAGLCEKHGIEVPDDLLMDLTACHLNGCTIDLPRLLAAPDTDFAHDVFGIRRHIDRETGGLGGCFLPRCAAASE